MASTTANPAAGAAAPTGKRRRIVLVAVVALGAAAAAAGGMYYFLMQQGLGRAAAGTSAHEAAPLPAPTFFALDPLTVNLQSDDGVQHYLRVGLTLKLTDPNAQARLTSRLPEIRSRILLALSNKHPDELASPDGKRALAVQLKGLIEEPLQPGNERAHVDDVLFTEFVVQ